MLNIFKKGEKEEKKPNLTKESKRNLKKRFWYLSTQLQDEFLDEEERDKIIDEMKFIKDVMPERYFKSIDIGPVLTALISGTFMIGTAFASYKLNNAGVFDKVGSSLLNPLNFKK